MTSTWTCYRRRDEKECGNKKKRSCQQISTPTTLIKMKKFFVFEVEEEQEMRIDMAAAALFSQFLYCYYCMVLEVVEIGGTRNRVGGEEVVKADTKQTEGIMKGK